MRHSHFVIAVCSVRYQIPCGNKRDNIEFLSYLWPFRSLSFPAAALQPLTTPCTDSRTLLHLWAQLRANQCDWLKP